MKHLDAEQPTTVDQISPSAGSFKSQLKISMKADVVELTQHLPRAPDSRPSVLSHLQNEEGAITAFFSDSADFQF